VSLGEHHYEMLSWPDPRMNEGDKPGDVFPDYEAASHHLRESGYDAPEDDDGHTVADSSLCDQFAEPDKEYGAGGE
jgi:hypothetical protein